MLLIIKLIAAFFIGLAGHQAHKPTHVFGPRWGSLVRYAIGIILYIPAAMLVKSSIPTHNDTHWGEMERDANAMLLAAGAVGSGVLIGHVLESHGENHER